MRRHGNKEKALLDRISAARMHLPSWVALSGDNSTATMRFKLKILGIEPEHIGAKNLLELIDNVGAQKMLNHQSISTRYAAVEREIKSRKVWK